MPDARRNIGASRPTAGISRIVRVPHGDCANAVGAAIAQVSGEADQVFRESREEAIAAARGISGARVVQADAERATL